MTTHRLVVLCSPVEGREAEFETWYDDVHIRDIAAIEGVVSARRMRVVDIAANAAETPAWRSLAIYEFDEDPDVVLARISQLRESGQMEISTALSSDGLIKMIVEDTCHVSNTSRSAKPD